MTEDEVFRAVALRVEQGRPTDLPGGFREDPASAEALDDAERIIGYPLPALLRRLYAEVANGGFGPFGGVEGVDGGYTGNIGMLADYAEWRDTGSPDGFPAWTPGVVSFCDLGCSMWALLDCRAPGGKIMFLDQSTLHPLDLSLARWFASWLAGDLDMDKLAAG